MSIIRHRQRTTTAITPHQGNKRILVPKRAVGGAGGGPELFDWGVDSAAGTTMSLPLAAPWSSTSFPTGNQAKFSGVINVHSDKDTAGAVTLQGADAGNGALGVPIGMVITGSAHATVPVSSIGVGDQATTTNFSPLGFAPEGRQIEWSVTWTKTDASTARIDEILINGVNVLAAPYTTPRSSFSVFRVAQSLFTEATCWWFRIDLITTSTFEFWAMDEGVGTAIANDPGADTPGNGITIGGTHAWIPA